jgi:hypothetical protein
VEYWQEYVRWTGVGKFELFESLWGFGYQSFTLNSSVQVEITADDLGAVPDGDYEFRHQSCSIGSGGVSARAEL